MRLNLIVAVARNRVIGRDNALPWRLREDLAHFKRTTEGHAVIMGRRTFESIGRALPNRRNIVVTRQPHWHAPGAEAAGSLEAACALCAEDAEVFLIGGAGLFREGLATASRLFVTEIARDFDGDTFFPPIPPAFHETERVRHTDGQDASLHYDFVIYER